MSNLMISNGFLIICPNFFRRQLRIASGFVRGFIKGVEHLGEAVIAILEQRRCDNCRIVGEFPV